MVHGPAFGSVAVIVPHAAPVIAVAISPTCTALSADIITPATSTIDRPAIIRCRYCSSTEPPRHSIPIAPIIVAITVTTVPVPMAMTVFVIVMLFLHQLDRKLNCISLNVGIGWYR